MADNSDEIREELKGKVKDFLGTVHNYSDLQLIESMFPSIIKEELDRRKRNEYSSLKFKFEIHRPKLKLVDLVAEEYFPCDFENYGFLFVTQPFCYAGINIGETKYIIWPSILPVERDVFLRWLYRTIPDKERRYSEVYIENMRRWYDDSEPFKTIVPYGENAHDYENSLLRLAIRVMQTYMEPIVINGSGELENFKPQEVWVGVVDGKLHFATKETPRFIKMWKNMRDFKLS